MTRIQSFVNALDVTNADCVQSERNLGETEMAYYLPSRENGVNDMYLSWLCLGIVFVDTCTGTSIWALVLIQNM